MHRQGAGMNCTATSVRASCCRGLPPRCQSVPHTRGRGRALRLPGPSVCRCRDENCREGEPGREDGSSNSAWSMQDFWQVVNDREASKRYCSTEPDFVRRKSELGLPDIDWGRYNQQVLFVDRSDTIRARMAAGVFEVVSNWNTLDMVLVQDRCGVDAGLDRCLDPSTVVALAGMAHPYGISSRHFTRDQQSFEPDDLYRYDVIVAMDTSVQEDLLRIAQQESDSALTASYLNYFTSKIARLSDFSGWCSDEHLCQKGGSAILPPQFSAMLSPHLSDARKVTDVVRPDLQAAEDTDEWRGMMLSIILGIAGLLKYLSDACPSDMPHWERLD